MSTTIVRALMALGVVATAAALHAESTARQSFLVSVPPRLSIKAPPVGAQAELPPQTQVELSPQAWDVAANSPAGATVQFATENCFHKLDDASVRRDAQLKVSIVSQSQSSAWTVTQAQASTDYLLGQETAAVQVRSSKPGSAVLGLTVTFLDGNAVAAPGGDYVTTVVGTITSN